jgi:hypothetical protein
MTGLLTLVVPPVLTAGLAALGVWLRQRSERRDLDQERHRVLAQVREEVDVIRAWVEAYCEVTPEEVHDQARKKAWADLDRAYQRLSQSLEVSRGIERRITVRNLFGIMLLAGKMQTSLGKTLRVVYYISLVWAVLWTAVGTTATIGSKVTVGGIFAAITAIIIGGVLPAFGFYTLAVRVDKRRITKAGRGAHDSSRDPAHASTTVMPGGAGQRAGPSN